MAFKNTKPTIKSVLFYSFKTIEFEKRGHHQDRELKLVTTSLTSR